MRSGTYRTKAMLTTTTIITMIVMGFPLGVHAAARSSDAPPRGLSVEDAAYYLEVGDTLPSSFRQLTPDEVTAQLGAPPEDSPVAIYRSDENRAFVVVRLAVGKGKNSRAIFADVFDHPEQLYTTEDFVSLLADADIPADQISVTSGEWHDVAAGDAAKTGLYTVNVAGQPAMRFEVLLLVVGRGNDTALVEIDHVFETVPTVDVTDVGGAVTAKIRSGPPSAEQMIAEAGLIKLADLPSGWEESPRASQNDPTAGSSDQDSQTPANEDEVLAIAKRIPACKAFAGLLASESDDTGAGGRATGSTTRSRENASVDGPRFEQGFAKVTSQVSVYPTTTAARGVLHLVRSRQWKPCLSSLYRSVTTTALQSAGTKLPPEQRKLLKLVDVKVATRQTAMVGDDRALFTVTVDLRPFRDASIVVEQEFVQVGRAVGVYSFRSADGGTHHEGVVRLVTDRLANAQAAHGTSAVS